MNEKKTEANSEITQQLAHMASTLQQQRTGFAPKTVTVVLSDDTLVVTLHHALTQAEERLAQTPEGAAQVQEYHRQLFATSSDSMRQEIKNITGRKVREAAEEIDTAAGAVIHAFPTGAIVQMFLLEPDVLAPDGVVCTPHYVLMESNRRIGPRVVPLLSGIECLPIYGFSDKGPYDKFCTNSPLALTPYPLVKGYLQRETETQGEGLKLVVVDPVGPNEPLFHAATMEAVLKAQEHGATRVAVTHQLKFDRDADAYRVEEAVA